MIEYDLEVDASGLNCPMPLLRLKKALQKAAGGQVIKIIATDPAAHLDIGVFSEQSGNPILETVKEAERQIFFVQKHD